MSYKQMLNKRFIVSFAKASGSYLLLLVTQVCRRSIYMIVKRRRNIRATQYVPLGSVYMDLTEASFAPGPDKSVQSCKLWHEKMHQVTGSLNLPLVCFGK